MNKIWGYCIIKLVFPESNQMGAEHSKQLLKLPVDILEIVISITNTLKSCKTWETCSILLFVFYIKKVEGKNKQ